MSLQGKVALVTGSSSGIGRGVALAFGQAGAKAVVVNFPVEAEASAAQAVCQALEAMGCEALAIRADVSSEQEVEQMVAQALSTFGAVDILVNNAGIAHNNRVEDMPVEVWDRVLGVHLRGTFLVTRALLPQMYARPRPHHQHRLPTRLQGRAGAERLHRCEGRDSLVFALAGAGNWRP